LRRIEMKLISLLIVFIVGLMFVQPSFAELDLDKAVLTIPKTHDVKPYIWHVLTNPRDYTLSLDHSRAIAGTDTHFKLTVKSGSGADINDIHVFITDKGLDTYKHLRPTRDASGIFTFNYNAPCRGEYRIETVFKSPGGWVDMSRDIEFSGVDGKHEEAEKDEGYSVKIKRYPKDIYAEHVGTLLFQLFYKGEPIRDLQKIDGAYMQVASWDEKFREFLFVDSEKNAGGPEVPVSIVFMKPGLHAVFAEFKHKGKIRRVDLVIKALEELPPVNLSVSP